MRRSERALACVGAASLLVACAGGAPPSKFAQIEKTANASSPLGPSFLLIAQPTDDAAMLGKILKVAPDETHPFEQNLAANPCVESLAEAKTSPTLNAFEDAQELGVGASAAATLGKFGFQGDATYATHFLYKINTTKRIARSETPEYVACCRQKDCGYGYVSSLVFGEGEFASAAETDLSGKVDVAVASASGTTALKTLHRKTVQGYIAAVITLAPGKPDAPPPEAPAANAIGVVASGPLGPAASDKAKAEYGARKISVCNERADNALLSAGPQQVAWAFCDAAGNMTENEFVRRYRATSTFHDLDEYEHDRAPVFFWTGVVGVIGGAGLLVYALTQPASFSSPPSAEFPHGCSTCGGTNLGFWVPLSAGILLLAEGVPMGIIWLGTHEGGPFGPHDLASEHDGRLAAARYNRALAREIARRATGGVATSPRPRIRPIFGVGTIGIGGTFE